MLNIYPVPDTVGRGIGMGALIGAYAPQISRADYNSACFLYVRCQLALLISSFLCNLYGNVTRTRVSTPSRGQNWREQKLSCWFS